MRRMKSTVEEIKDVIGDLTPKLTKKLWGYERLIVNHKLYCGKILTVLPNGNACSLHYHVKKHETFHVLRGELMIQTFVKQEKFFDKAQALVLHPGSTLVLPPYTAHRFWTEGEVCDFVEISTHDDPEDSIRFAKSGIRPASLIEFGVDLEKLEWRK